MTGFGFHRLFCALIPLPAVARKAKLTQLEGDIKKEAKEKHAALQRVAHLETMRGWQAELEAEVEELTEQLQLANTGRHAKQKEAQELQQKIADLEEKSSVLAASRAAAEEREAALTVRLKCPRERHGLEGLILALLSQAKLSQAEAEQRKEAEEKTAALKRAAKLESANAELGNLESEVEELTRQLQLASAGYQAQQEDIKALRQRAHELEAESAEAKEREALLQVGGNARAKQGPRGSPPPHPLACLRRLTCHGFRPSLIAWQRRGRLR